MFFWKRRREKIQATSSDQLISKGLAVRDREEAQAERTLELAGRRTSKTVVATIGMTVLELAERHDVDFASNCRRGTCARCRCRVEEGSEFLSPPNEAETARLMPEELADGYRLGCQARVMEAGRMKIRHAPYF